MTHVDSGWECLAPHGIDLDGSGHDPCIECAICGKYIRPNKMNEECSSPNRVLQLRERGAVAGKAGQQIADVIPISTGLEIAEHGTKAILDLL